MQQSSQLCSKHHKRRHPAEIMAEYPFTEQNGRNKNQQHNTIINDITWYTGDRYAMLCFKKEISLQRAIAISIRTVIAKADRCYPHNPYAVFDIVFPSLARFLVINRKGTFLQSACRAKIGTKKSAKGNRKQELQQKNDKTSVDDSMQARIDDQRRTEIVKCYREAQQGCYEA